MVAGLLNEYHKYRLLGKRSDVTWPPHSLIQKCKLVTSGIYPQFVCGLLSVQLCYYMCTQPSCEVSHYLIGQFKFQNVLSTSWQTTCTIYATTLKANRKYGKSMERKRSSKLEWKMEMDTTVNSGQMYITFQKQISMLPFLSRFSMPVAYIHSTGI